MANVDASNQIEQKITFSNWNSSFATALEEDDDDGGNLCVSIWYRANSMTTMPHTIEGEKKTDGFDHVHVVCLLLV